MTKNPAELQVWIAKETSVLGAHRMEEKRLSMPYQHLSKATAQGQAPVELQPSMITKYNYVGVPGFSR